MCVRNEELVLLSAVYSFFSDTPVSVDHSSNFPNWLILYPDSSVASLDRLSLRKDGWTVDVHEFYALNNTRMSSDIMAIFYYFIHSRPENLKINLSLDAQLFYCTFIKINIQLDIC